MAFIDQILEWEIQEQIFSKGVIDGFAFYSYMRRDFINMLLNEQNHIPVKSFEKETEGKLSLLFRLMKKSEKTEKKNVEVLFLPHPRRQKQGELYESIFTDFLMKDFPDSVSLERCFTGHSHFEPAATPNLIYIDRILLKSYLYRIFQKTFCKGKYEKVYQQIRDIMEAPFSALEEKLSLPVKRKTYYDRVVTLYYFYQCRKKLYLRLLHKLSPKVIVEAVGKSFDAMLLNELAKEMKIKTIEVQHCLLGPTSQYPSGVEVLQFPDFYLTFSDYWKDYASYPIPEDHVISCGYPFFESQVKKYRQQNEKKPGQKTVLFISGIAYGKELSQVAVKLQQKEDDSIRIIYKLHSDEFKDWRTLYPELAASEIEVIDTRDRSIYEFFAMSDIQVGVFSTALYEGLAFDLHTCILNIPFAADFIEFCHKGYGTLIQNAEDLYQIAKKDTEQKSISGLFWKENGSENVKRAIREIIE